MTKIALIAGETSGDQLGGWLMEALKAKAPNVQFVGLGGMNMRAQGLESLFPMREISLMGFAEIVPHIRNVKRRIRQMVEFIEQENPDVLVTIDSPGFATRVVRQLRERQKVQPKFVHYVAPTVWAYKPERARKFAQLYDKMLCLLPFEPPYFEAEKLSTDFVGHEVAWWWKSRGCGDAFRRKHGIAPETPLLAVFPGSRNGEIKRLWPIFRVAIDKLHAHLPAMNVVIQVQPSLIERMQAETRGWNVAPLILPNTEDKKDLFAASTAAIAKSGTIGLECVLAGLPSIIAYAASPLTAFIIRRMANIRFANLGNVLADSLIVPELIQEQCTPENIVREILPLLNDPEARNAQVVGLTDIASKLGVEDPESPSAKAASVILGMI